MILIQHLTISKMDVILSSSLDHHRRKQVKSSLPCKRNDVGRLLLVFSYFSESGLVLNASTVVLTDERISHVGDRHAVETSCLHVELVDISSNAFSDWHEVCLFIHLIKTKSIDYSFIYLDITSSFLATAC